MTEQGSGFHNSLAHVESELLDEVVEHGSDAAYLLLAVPALSLGALIWLAHIGFDRMLGYGLKYGTAFGDTHLGRVGWVDSRASSSAMSQR